jgi:hypothetical protein
MVQLQLLELRLDDVAAIRVLGLVLVVVVLVVVFRRVEGVCGGDFVDDRLIEMQLGSGIGGSRSGVAGLGQLAWKVFREEDEDGKLIAEPSDPKKPPPDGVARAA